MFVLIRWRFFLLSEGGNSYSDATKITHEQSRNRSLEVRASWNQLQENKEESCDLFPGAIELGRGSCGPDGGRRRWMVGASVAGGRCAAACARVDDGWWMAGADDGWACLPGYARLD